MKPDDNIVDFQNRLLQWFSEYRRDFPWRETTDPFAVLLAEKLLQQTRARATVVDVYLQILSLFPNPQELGEANIEDIERIIAPLGLKYRAKELVTLAQELTERYQGNIPGDFHDLMSLTGIGEYCAYAVLCFAFGKQVPIVDTNIARFLHRLYNLPEPLPANPARKKYLYDIARILLTEANSRELNLAILDLCTLVCRPHKPLCETCPVSEYCHYSNRKMSSS